jgi:hypothetical protein
MGDSNKSLGTEEAIEGWSLENLFPRLPHWVFRSPPINIEVFRRPDHVYTAEHSTRPA